MEDLVKLENAFVLDTPQGVLHAMTVKLCGAKTSAYFLVISEGIKNRNGVFEFENPTLCEAVDNPDELNASIQRWREHVNGHILH